MIDLGLTAAHQAALLRALTSEHLVGVTAQIMTLNHTHLGFFSGAILGGQVNIDADAEVTRQLQLTAYDPGLKIGADLLDGSPRLDRMIRVHYNVYVEEDGIGWIPIPIFTGPITKTSRGVDGILTLEAMGKELIANKPTRNAARWNKGENRVKVVREMLRDMTGERRFGFPEGWTARMPKDRRLSGMAPPWAHAKVVTRSMNAQLFYDGRGTARMRKSPTRSVFIFKDGDGGSILTDPNLSESNSDIINMVKVVGAVPTGKKVPISYIARLPKADPYSPESLARGGKPQYYAEDIDDDTVRSLKEAKKLATERLNQTTVERYEVSFDSLPIPMLEEEDPIRIETSDMKLTTRLKQLTIPLGHGGVSTIGYIAPVTKRKGRY